MKFLDFSLLIVFITCNLFYLSSCKKLSYAEMDMINYQLAQDSMELDECMDLAIDFYFKGKINGKEFCYFHGENGYRAYSTGGYRIITEGPELIISSSGPVDTSSNEGTGVYLVFGLNNELQHLQETFLFTTPFFPFNTSVVDIADSTLKIGTLPLASDVTSIYNGFNLNLKIPYKANPDLDGFTTFLVESRFGEQDTSRLEIIFLEKTEEDDDYVYYDIELEVECNLYHNERYGGGLYGRLEEGILKMRLKVIK